MFSFSGDGNGILQRPCFYMRVWFALLVVLCVCLAAGTVQDFAKNKPASMSTTFNSSYGAENAVRGWDNLSRTKFNQSFAWWRVDLQAQVTSPYVSVYWKRQYGIPKTSAIFELQFYTSKENFSSPNSSDWSPPSWVQNPLNWTVNTFYWGHEYIIKGEMRFVMLYTTSNISGHGAYLEFESVQILACPEGFYGGDCTKNCSSRQCNGTSTCPYQDGACDNECLPKYRSYWPPDCTECADYNYGSTCDKSCSLRKCDPGEYDCPKNGSCQHGCEKGYTGSDCADCEGDVWGWDCQFNCAARRCKGPSRCPRLGACDDGCLDGFREPECFVCLPGLYGPECSKNCSLRNCEDMTEFCSKRYFSCSSCKPGWIGDDCTQACHLNSYGRNCSKSCRDRHCANSSDPCDTVYGRCPSGCEPGYSGEDCTQLCPPHLYGQNCSKLCLDRMCTNFANTCEARTGKCWYGCQYGWRGEDCTINCPEGRHDNCTTSSSSGSSLKITVMSFVLLLVFLV